MSFSETISPLLGRLIFVWFYANAAMDVAHNWSAYSDQLAARHMPLPPLLRQSCWRSCRWRPCSG